MATNYIGNNDYRGYLNYLSQNGQGSQKAQASSLLKLVGNDAKFSGNYWDGSDIANANSQFYQQFQSANAAPNKSPGSTIYSGYVAPAKAANFNIQGAYNSAYGQAAGSVNAMYDKYLNTFLDQQRNAMAKQQNIYQNTQQSYDTALKNTEEANKLTGERSQQDFYQAKDQTNLQQDQFQTDSGTEFAISRIEEARKTAQSGATGGLSAQKTANTQEARNTGEARQVEKFDQEKYNQELVKARTFEDLAISSKLAQEKTATGKKAAQFDLDNYIIASQLEERSYRDKDQENRNKDIIEERNRIAREQYQNWLGTLSDPVRIATAAKYAGSF